MLASLAFRTFLSVPARTWVARAVVCGLKYGSRDSNSHFIARGSPVSEVLAHCGRHSSGRACHCGSSSVMSCQDARLALAAASRRFIRHGPVALECKLRFSKPARLGLDEISSFLDGHWISVSRLPGVCPRSWCRSHSRRGAHGAGLRVGPALDSPFSHAALRGVRESAPPNGSGACTTVRRGTPRPHRRCRGSDFRTTTRLRCPQSYSPFRRV